MLSHSSSVVRQELGDLAARAASVPRTWLRSYNKVKALKESVWELDVSGADRLLFHVKDGMIILLVVGKHEIVRDYVSTANVSREVATAAEPPKSLTTARPHGFFTFDAHEQWQSFANEADPAWLSYLDTEQGAVVCQLLNAIDHRGTDLQSSPLALVMGGPGTGKTSILLNLLDRLFELDLMPEVVVSDQVADYINAASRIDLRSYQTTLQQAQVTPRGDVLLVDDPDDVDSLKALRSLAQSRKYRAVVALFDPLQVRGKLDDLKLARLSEQPSVATYQLSYCYRQKKVVGQAALRMLNAVAASIPFLPGSRKAAGGFTEARVNMTRLANALVFRNPSGRAKVHAVADERTVASEVARILRHEGRWTHWPPLLIAVDDENRVELSPGCREILRRIPHRMIAMSEATSVKGVEFQHVFAFLSDCLFNQLESGFVGSGRRIYELRQLYRIPYTRAKDSLVTFIAASAG